MIETPAGPLRIVKSNRAAGSVGVGDLVAIVPTDAIPGHPRLLDLPTVKRLARNGMRSIVLVPVDEVTLTFGAASMEPESTRSARRPPRRDVRRGVRALNAASIILETEARLTRLVASLVRHQELRTRLVHEGAALASARAAFAGRRLASASAN